MNENYSEIPLGILFSIATNNKALQYFAGLNDKEKENIKEYIKDTDGEQVKEKISNVVEHLENRNLNFL